MMAALIFCHYEKAGSHEGNLNLAVDTAVNISEIVAEMCDQQGQFKE